MSRFQSNIINNVINKIVKYAQRPLTCHCPQFIILPSIKDLNLIEVLPSGLTVYSGPYNYFPVQGTDYPTNLITVTFDPNNPGVPSYSFNVTLYFSSIYPNTEFIYYVYTITFTLNLSNIFYTSAPFYYPSYPTIFSQGPYTSPVIQGSTPDITGYQSLEWPNNLVSLIPSGGHGQVNLQVTNFYETGTSPNIYINAALLTLGYNFLPSPCFYSGPFTTIPTQNTPEFPNNISESIAPILPYTYSVQNTIYYLITLPGISPGTTASGSVIPVPNIAYYVCYNIQIINYNTSPIDIWGTGPMNLNYYIGSNFSPETTDTAEIDYINLVPNPDPTQIDIADASGGFILNPRGYAITCSKVYYFHYLAALFRIQDDNIDTGYRYYLELQPITSPNRCGSQKLQFFSYITVNDVLNNLEVDSEIENTLPNNFTYQPYKGYRLALWGEQGPNPWSRKSASVSFNSTPTELINYDEAEKQLELAQQTGNNILIAEAQALVNSTYAILQDLHPRVEVWPSFNNPISLNAWVGIQPPTIKSVYYVCKYSVNKVNNLLEISSNSYTKPIGSPLYYKHYNSEEEVYLWDGQPGNSNISIHQVFNPLVIQGYNNTKGTIGYLRFIPIVSNSVYINDQITCELIDKGIPIGDHGFVMSFELDKIIGLNNTGNIMYVRRLNPSPYYLDLKNSGFFNLPYLLNDYKNVDNIIYDYIDETKGPHWNNTNNTVYYYPNSEPVVPEGFTLAGIRHSHQNNTFNFSNHHRKLRKADTNTLILKINFEY